MIPITFTNIDDEAFTCKWDGRSYTIEAGKTLKLPDELARHFAKHLCNKMLHKLGVQVNHTGGKGVPGKEELLKKINKNLTWHKSYHEVQIDMKGLNIKAAPGNDARIALLNAESDDLGLHSEVPLDNAKPDHEEPAKGNPDPSSEDYEPEPDFSSALPAKEEAEDADVDPENADEDKEPSESDFENDNQ